MSLGYAEKLSYREDVGAVGMPENFDSPRLLQQKIKQLAQMVKKSKHLVVFTGAGISTSCGIPDFRGPKGVWTLQREGKGVPKASLPFHRATPSITHMALVALEKAGILKFVISQNVDSLHLRSGIPREKLAELHGNSFMEVCPSCKVEYLRDFEVETIGMKETSRRCSDVNCGAKLRDTIIDWEDELPEKEIDTAEKHCRMADVVLCLGTSLQITPACDLPLKSLRGGGKIIIVNLQQTPKDNKAKLVIHGLVDKVISGVLHSLDLQIPPYVRVDFFQIIFKHYCCPAETKYTKWSLKISSVHGEKVPVPFIKSVEVSFPERMELKSALLCKQPFLLKRETLKSRPLKMRVRLIFSDGCGCQFSSIDFPVDFQASSGTINQDKTTVIQQLMDVAIQDQCCGQISLIERNIVSAPRKENCIYAVATNITQYGKFSSGSAEFSEFHNEDEKDRKEINICGNENSAKRREDPNDNGVNMKKVKVQ